MVWDDDKNTGDDLTADEWDAHVADQKSRSEFVIQGTEPTPANYDDGAEWKRRNLTIGAEASGSPQAINNTDTADGGFAYNANTNDVYYSDSTNSQISAQDLSTGTTEWTTSTLPGTPANQIIYDDVNDRIYATGGAPNSDDVFVGAWNPSDGTEIWSTIISTTQAIRGITYDSTNDNLVYSLAFTEIGSLNASDGVEQWTRALTNEEYGGIQFISNSGTDKIFVCEFAFSSSVTARNLDPTDGSDLFTSEDVIQRGVDTNNLTADSEGNFVYICDDNANVKKIDLTDHTTIWTHNFHSANVNDLNYDSKTKTLWSCSGFNSDFNVVASSLEGPYLYDQHTFHGDRVYRVAIDDTNDRIISYGLDDNFRFASKTPQSQVFNLIDNEWLVEE